MKRYDKPIELIIEKKPVADGSKAFFNAGKRLEAAGIPVEDVKDSPAPEEAGATKDRNTKKKKTETSQPGKTYIRTSISDIEVNPWDVAHESITALGSEAAYVEPDTWNEFTTGKKAGLTTGATKSFGTGSKGDDFDPDWQPNKNLIWHLDDAHSQLMSARKAVAGEDYKIRIGHLDTGYSNHAVIPDSIRKNPLQKNFIDGEPADNAFDSNSEGFLKQPGHGTGTLGLLAGTKVNLDTATGTFSDFLGGAYFADVVCCRISKSVILFKTSAFAEAIKYLTQLTLNGTPVHVVSMSMGGAPSKAWASAVNDAYMAGITIVTAAGNNFSGLPTRHVIYPARFERVIAACGVTFDYAPYYTKLINEMQGNYGPSRHMNNAIAAFTPNTPWASMNSGRINFSGAGTSSATPQVASAAAIYYRKNHKKLDALQPWQRVEAIRNALFSSALKKVKTGFDSYKDYFGNGILQANAALAVPVATNLPMASKDSVPWFPILDTIFKARPDKEQMARLEMFNTELAQLVFLYPELAAKIDNDAKPYDKIGKKKWNDFVKAVIEHPETSVTLKKFLKDKYKK